MRRRPVGLATATTDAVQARGGLLATLLAGAWRAKVVPTTLTEDELRLEFPFVLKSGTAGLAWRRIRGTPLASTEAGQEISRARLVKAAEAAILEAQIERMVSTGTLADARPILVKGWAHARLYPEPGLRPYSDVDFFVTPERYQRIHPETAMTPVADPERPVSVDLQTVWVDLPDRSWGQILAHSRVVTVRSSQIRVPGPEDALRLSCLHLLRHLACNPVWLCDVAVMLENLPADFDWEYCLSGCQRRTQWMLSVVRLANQVLGANVQRCPSSLLPPSVPSWMVKTLLRVWGHGDLYQHPWPLPRPLASVFRNDFRRLPSALAERWPNPLQSIWRFSWPVNRFSGRFAQVLDYALRALIWGHRQIDGHRGRVPIG
jgi:hypothetical protein